MFIDELRDKAIEVGSPIKGSTVEWFIHLTPGVKLYEYDSLNKKSIKNIAFGGFAVTDDTTVKNSIFNDDADDLDFLSRARSRLLEYLSLTDSERIELLR